MNDDIPNEIQEVFDTEYSRLKNRFIIRRLSVEAAWDNSEVEINRPGVYVFWSGEEVIKVGKSQSNSKSRACEHLDPKKSSDSDMIALGHRETELILFNVKNDKDIHWILGLEYYFEKHLNPRIYSSRNG